MSDKAKHFSFLHNVQTRTTVHRASYKLDTGAVSPEVKQPGSEAGHTPTSSVQLQKPSWCGA
jgi:hypothetical protein